MTQNDKNYYAARLMVELAAAEASTNAEARAAHEGLAQFYAELVAGCEDPAAPGSAAPSDGKAIRS